MYAACTWCNDSHAMVMFPAACFIACVPHTALQFRWWRSVGLDTYPVEIDHFAEYVLVAALARVYRGAVFFTWPFMAAMNMTAYSTKYELDYVARVVHTQCSYAGQRRCYCLPVSNATPSCCDGQRMPCRKRAPYTNCLLPDYQT